MRRNVGGCDRMVRVCAGFMLLALGLFVLGGFRGEVWGLVVAAIGAIALATGLIGFCPLYVPLGISTARDDHWMRQMAARCGCGPAWAGNRSHGCGSKTGEPRSDGDGSHTPE